MRCYMCSPLTKSLPRSGKTMRHLAKVMTGFREPTPLCCNEVRGFENALCMLARARLAVNAIQDVRSSETRGGVSARTGSLESCQRTWRAGQGPFLRVRPR